MDWTRIALVIFGFWGVGDGIGSIIVFRSQPLIDHIPRVVRSLVGVGIVAIALWGM